MIQNATDTGQGALVFFLFDLLFLNGENLTALPLVERKAQLASLLKGAPDSLQYNYHQPVASVGVNIGHDLTALAGWNYYQYGEKSFVGPTDPRYFHANNATISLRWAF